MVQLETSSSHIKVSAHQQSFFLKNVKKKIALKFISKLIYPFSVFYLK